LTEADSPAIVWPKPRIGRTRRLRARTWQSGVDWRGAGVGWSSPGMLLWRAGGSLTWLMASLSDLSPAAAAEVVRTGNHGTPFEPFGPYTPRTAAMPLVSSTAARPQGWRADMPWDLPSQPDGRPAVRRVRGPDPTESVRRRLPATVIREIDDAPAPRTTGTVAKHQPGVVQPVQRVAPQVLLRAPEAAPEALEAPAPRPVQAQGSTPARRRAPPVAKPAAPAPRSAKPPTPSAPSPAVTRSAVRPPPPTWAPAPRPPARPPAPPPVGALRAQKARPQVAPGVTLARGLSKATSGAPPLALTSWKSSAKRVATPIAAPATLGSRRPPEAPARGTPAVAPRPEARPELPGVPVRRRSPASVRNVDAPRQAAAPAATPGPAGPSASSARARRGPATLASATTSRLAPAAVLPVWERRETSPTPRPAAPNAAAPAARRGAPGPLRKEAARPSVLRMGDQAIPLRPRRARLKAQSRPAAGVQATSLPEPARVRLRERRVTRWRAPQAGPVSGGRPAAQATIPPMVAAQRAIPARQGAAEGWTRPLQARAAAPVRWTPPTVNRGGLPTPASLRAGPAVLLTAAAPAVAEAPPDRLPAAPAVPGSPPRPRARPAARVLAAPPAERASPSRPAATNPAPRTVRPVATQTPIAARPASPRGGAPQGPGRPQARRVEVPAPGGGTVAPVRRAGRPAGSPATARAPALTTPQAPSAPAAPWRRLVERVAAQPPAVADARIAPDRIAPDLRGGVASSARGRGRAAPTAPVAPDLRARSSGAGPIATTPAPDSPRVAVPDGPWRPAVGRVQRPSMLSWATDDARQPRSDRRAPPVARRTGEPDAILEPSTLPELDGAAGTPGSRRGATSAPVVWRRGDVRPIAPLMRAQVVPLQVPAAVVEAEAPAPKRPSDPAPAERTSRRSARPAPVAPRSEPARREARRAEVAETQRLRADARRSPPLPERTVASRPKPVPSGPKAPAAAPLRAPASNSGGPPQRGRSAVRPAAQATRPTPVTGRPTAPPAVARVPKRRPQTRALTVALRPPSERKPSVPQVRPGDAAAGRPRASGAPQVRPTRRYAGALAAGASVLQRVVARRATTAQPPGARPPGARPPDGVRAPDAPTRVLRRSVRSAPIPGLSWTTVPETGPSAGAPSAPVPPRRGSVSAPVPPRRWTAGQSTPALPGWGADPARRFSPRTVSPVLLSAPALGPDGMDEPAVVPRAMGQSLTAPPRAGQRTLPRGSQAGPAASPGPVRTLARPPALVGPRQDRARPLAGLGAREGVRPVSRGAGSVVGAPEGSAVRAARGTVRVAPGLRPVPALVTLARPPQAEGEPVRGREAGPGSAPPPTPPPKRRPRAPQSPPGAVRATAPTASGAPRPAPARPPKAASATTNMAAPRRAGASLAPLASFASRAPRGSSEPVGAPRATTRSLWARAAGVEQARSGARFVPISAPPNVEPEADRFAIRPTGGGALQASVRPLARGGSPSAAAAPRVSARPLARSAQGPSAPTLSRPSGPAPAPARRAQAPTAGTVAPQVLLRAPDSPSDRMGDTSAVTPAAPEAPVGASPRWRPPSAPTPRLAAPPSVAPTAVVLSQPRAAEGAPPGPRTAPNASPLGAPSLSRPPSLARGGMAWPQHTARVAEGRAVAINAPRMGGTERVALTQASPEAEVRLARQGLAPSSPGSPSPTGGMPSRPQAPALRPATPVMLRAPAAASPVPEPSSADRAEDKGARAPRPRVVPRKKLSGAPKAEAQKPKKSPQDTQGITPVSWSAAPSSTGPADRVYEEASVRRPSPARKAPAPRQATEEQVFEVLKALVTRSPEAKRLISEVYREIEAIRRLENMRKF
jgi:hypothetical protein